MNANLKNVPTYSRWQEMIQKLKCPQCLVHHSSTLTSLERHVILHCKSRPPLMKYHYIKQLKKLHEQCEDVLDVVRLTLEAKLLQWSRDGMPDLLPPVTQKEMGKAAALSKQSSGLLDLWRLWCQEVDQLDQQHPANDILQLIAQSEVLNWEPTHDSLQPISSDGQLNTKLMSDISARLKKMNEAYLEEVSKTLEGADQSSINRLEREAYFLSCMSHS